MKITRTKKKLIRKLEYFNFWPSTVTRKHFEKADSNLISDKKRRIVNYPDSKTVSEIQTERPKLRAKFRIQLGSRSGRPKSQQIQSADMTMKPRSDRQTVAASQHSHSTKKGKSNSQWWKGSNTVQADTLNVEGHFTPAKFKNVWYYCQSRRETFKNILLYSCTYANEKRITGPSCPSIRPTVRMPFSLTVKTIRTRTGDQTALISSSDAFLFPHFLPAHLLVKMLSAVIRKCR